jgi:hypothetical protein
VAVQQPVHPCAKSAVVSQHPGPLAPASPVGPRADVNVVVHLQVPDPELAHEEIDDPVQVLGSSRVAEVKVVPALLHHPLSAPGEEGRDRELGSHGATYPDHLRLQPQSRDHA